VNTMESFNRLTPFAHFDEYVLVPDSYRLTQQESLICAMSQRAQSSKLPVNLLLVGSG